MVILARYDVRWNKRNLVPGSLYYEDNLGKRVDVPLAQVRIFSDPITPRIINGNGLDEPRIEPVSADEAIDIAEKKGGDYIVPAFGGDSYVVLTKLTRPLTRCTLHPKEGVLYFGGKDSRDTKKISLDKIEPIFSVSLCDAYGKKRKLIGVEKIIADNGGDFYVPLKYRNGSANKTAYRAYHLKSNTNNLE